MIGTTCELVLQQGEVTIESGVDNYVPKSPNPMTFKREAFVGQPILNSTGEIIGLIGIQHENKFQDTSLIRSIMRILAPRTFAEYSRLLAHNLLVDKNRYYQYILENVSSPIIATNSEGIIQNATNSVLRLLGLPLQSVVGNPIGSIFIFDKQLFEQSFFFTILTSNINTPIVAKVTTKNPELSELIFETKEFVFETGNKEYIFTVSEKNNAVSSSNEIKELDYFVREAKILELRTVLLELQQSQTKNPIENMDICLQTVSKALSIEYSGYWSWFDNCLKCERFFEVIPSQFNSNFEGFIINESEYGDYLHYFTTLKEPSVIYDVYTKPFLNVFKSYFVQYGVQYIIEIPIWVNGELKGLFCSEGKDKTRRFEEYEIAFLSAVSLIISQGLQQTISNFKSPVQEKLQSSLLLAFHSLTVPFIILDTKTLQIVDVNDAWANTFNYHKDALIGLSLQEIGFFKNYDNSLKIEAEEIFNIEEALNQKAFTYVDYQKNKKEFVLTSTQCTLEDSLVTLYYFHPVSVRETLPIEESKKNEIDKSLNENYEFEPPTSLTFERLSQLVLTEFSPIVEEKNLSFSVYVEENIKHILVPSQTNLHLAVQLLVQNALDYTTKGFISLSFISTLSPQNEQMLSIEVKDSGIGMNEAKVTSIINSFSKSDYAQNTGLVRVRDIVATVEGSISIDSVPNKGTTMVIQFPLQTTSEEEEISEDTIELNSEEEFSEATIAIEEKMFLLQRNSSIQSENIEQFLTQLGALNYFTHSLEETKEVCEFIHFECIVLFLDQWNVDDITLLTNLQEQTINSTTPIIVITSSMLEDHSDVQSVAIEIIHTSEARRKLIETLEILFPKDATVSVENFE